MFELFCCVTFEWERELNGFQRGPGVSSNGVTRRARIRNGDINQMKLNHSVDNFTQITRPIFRENFLEIRLTLQH